METIIFVCTGNTCRSPMAEGLFRAHNGEEKTGLTAASAGLYTENGLPASANGSHYDRLCELFPDCADKIFTLLPEDISDPFGGDLATYRRSAAEIDKGVQAVIKNLSR